MHEDHIELTKNLLVHRGALRIYIIYIPFITTIFQACSKPPRNAKAWKAQVAGATYLSEHMNQTKEMTISRGNQDRAAETTLTSCPEDTAGSSRGCIAWWSQKPLEAANPAVHSESHQLWLRKAADPFIRMCTYINFKGIRIFIYMCILYIYTYIYTRSKV